MPHTILKSVTVYKKALVPGTGGGRHVIVKLRLTPGTKITQPIEYPGKNRADRALVVSFENLHGKPLKNFRRAIAWYNGQFEYVKGAIVLPERAFSGTNAECASGIHFLLTRKQAQGWPL